MTSLDRYTGVHGSIRRNLRIVRSDLSGLIKREHKSAVANVSAEHAAREKVYRDARRLVDHITSAIDRIEDDLRNES